MKSRIVFLFLLLFPLYLFAKIYRGSDADKKVKGSDFVITDSKDNIKFVRLSAGYQISGSFHSTWLLGILELQEYYELKLKHTETDKPGNFHYRYQLYYKNYPVEGSVYYVHTSDGKVTSANGDLLLTDKTLPAVRISEDTAFMRALEYTGAEKYLWESKAQGNRPMPETVILYEEGQYRPAYKYDIYALKPLSRKYIYVDAQSGKIIRTRDRIQHADEPGTAVTMYNGTKTIIADSYSGYYRLRESGRGGGIQTYDMNNDIDYYYAVDFTDADNYWNTTTNLDDAAYDAHFGTEMTYDFYYYTFGRNSYDNAGAPLLSYIHYDYGYANAFWDGQQMTYGDGDGYEYSPLTSTDIIAHEITHGVTEYSAALDYWSEPGALNESFSDIFGACVDFYANPGTANFLMGDQVSLTGTSFRNLAAPNATENPHTYHGNYWEYTDYDNQGVHINSTVQSYWFYLLCTGGSGVNDMGNSYSIASIGMDAAAQIAYRTLTVYLTPYSQYADARTYSIQSAVDLFGECSDEVIAVTDAWYAVGIGSVFSNAVVAAFSTSQTYACQTPAAINFSDQCINGSSWFWDFGDGSTSAMENPTHTYSSTGNYTVSLIVTGSALCGNTDTLIKPGYITVTNTGGPVAAACTPEAPSSANGIGIYNVTFNDINNSSGDGSEGYMDFTCSSVTTVMEGKKYRFSVTTGPTEYEDVFAWIDLNNDGLFNNEEELVFFSDNMLQHHSDSIIIPAASCHDTLLRLRVASDFASNPIDSACTDPSYGQYEDYTVVVLENLNPPQAGFTSDKVVANTGEQIYFTDQSLNLPDTWLWLFPGGTPSSSSDQYPVVEYSNTGTYDVTLVVSNSYGSDTLYMPGYMTLTNTYLMCQSAGSSETSGLLYDSGGPSGNYANYEYCTFLVEVNCASTITLSFSMFNTESYCDYIYVYDGTGTGGQLLLSTSGSYLPAPVTATSGAMFIVFETDGSVLYPGFAASWVAQLPPPVQVVADFDISDTNPPLGTDVTFNDVSTGDPVAWLWNFGDGNTSTDQDPIHAFYTPGDFDITLIVQNCYGADTVVHSLNVQEAPSVTVSPYSFDITLVSCNDSVSEALTIFNNGSGTLEADISNVSFFTTGSATLLTDDFESGISSSKWSNTSGTVSSSCGTNAGSGALYFNSDYERKAETVPLNIPAPGAVRFFLKIGSASSPCEDADSGEEIVLEYSVDNGTIWSNINTYYTTSYYNFTFVEEQIPAAALTPATQFRWRQISHSGSGYDNWSIDDVAVNCEVTEELVGSGSILPGDSSVFYIPFYADGLASGSYNSELHIETNDPAVPLIIIPYQLTLTGAPYIELSDISIDYGSVMEFSSVYDTVVIFNTGCDTLFIDNIETTVPEFVAGTYPPYILPFDSSGLVVVFSPSGMGYFSGYLNIYNNDADTTVSLTGTGTGAPVITFVPDSFYVTVLQCDDTLHENMVIYNSGDGPLSVDISNASMSQGTSALYDDFEDGDYNGWTVNYSYSAQITSVNPGNGNYSLAITGGNYSLYDGLYQTFLSSTPEYISVKIKPAVYEYTGFFAVGNNLQYGDEPMFWLYFQDDQTIYVSNCYVYTPYVINQWYTFEFKNIDYVAKNFDLYINNALIAEDVAFFNTYLSYITEVHLYNYYYSVTYFDDVIIGYAIQESDWLSLQPETGTVQTGDSLVVDVVFNSAGMNAGTYQGEISIVTDDPVNPEITVPCTMEIIGTPEMDICIDEPCFDMGDVQEGAVATDSIPVYNAGCGNLIISDVTNFSSEFTVLNPALQTAPGDTGWISISFNPSTIGTYNDTLSVFSNDTDTVICISGTGLGAPDASVSPAQFIVNVTCSDSVTLPLTVYNTDGLGDLEFGIGSSSQLVEILALTYGVDMYTEYPNTISAINQYFTDYNLTEINTTNASQLQTALSGKDIFLVPEQESGSSSVFTGFATVLQTFVNQGGTVIFCGTDNSSCIFNTGLFTGSFYTYVYYETIYVTDPTHPVTDQVPSGFTAPDATFCYSIGNGDAVTLVAYNGYDIVTVREVGQGKVILVGFDYYELNQNSSRLIANAVEWAAGNLLPGWMSVDAASGTVTPGDSGIVNITFNGSGLPGGNYYYDLNIMTNDPQSSVFSIPCILSVAYSPCADFDFNISYCTGTTAFTDMTINNPTSWIWSFGDGSVSALQNPIHIYTAEETFSVQLVACNTFGCDTISYPVGIYSLGGPVTAICTPVVSSIYEEMGIQHVLFNTIDNETAMEYYGYRDYTCDFGTTVIAGRDYDLLVASFYYSVNARGWIDYNNNGSFETDELILESDNLMTHTADVQIPLNAVQYTALRMRLATDYYSYSPPTACFAQYGQFEDYTIVIIPDTFPPVAGFAWETVDNCQGIVHFTDLTQNAVTDWIWDFGDGMVSCQQSPYHTFAESGDYLITLLTSNDYDADSYSETITVSVFDPVMTIAGSLFPDSIISFSAVASNAVSWYWEFGDGASDSTETPAHTYSSAGEYIVTLTITNNAGCTKNITETITIGSSENSPVAGFDVAVSCGAFASFTDTSLNNPTSWLWDFGDGDTSAVQNPVHQYDIYGNYIVELTSCNAGGCDVYAAIVDVSHPMDLTDALCYPQATSPNPIVGIVRFEFNTISVISVASDAYEDYTCTDSTHVFSGGSYAIEIETTPETEENVRAWIDYDNDGTFGNSEMIFESLHAVGHTGTVTIPGNVVFNTPLRLRIASDNHLLSVPEPCDDVTHGQFEDYVVVIHPAVCNACFYYDVLDECQGLVSFTGFSALDPVSWSWNFGDGGVSGIQSPYHIFTMAGTYAVTLTVSDGSANYIAADTLFFVNLGAQIQATGTFISNNPVYFGAVSPGAVSWQWDFGDGSADSVGAPAHTYSNAGTYTVVLTVVNESGCEYTTDETIHIIQTSVPEPSDSYADNIHIYPNPNSGKFTIRFSGFKNGAVEIYITDLPGRALFFEETAVLTEIDKQIDLTGLAKGIYLVKIMTDDRQVVRKIIVR
ncbi:MAG: PKD domain-containing protein [Bacteroidetes bacterium]|nr:PKD domain-containing protein [Bacteroidota bacterium]